MLLQDKWHHRFMDVAELVSTWSKDPSTKVGCVIVKDRKIVATGYNGFPPGIADDERLDNREEKYPLVVHAEMNALLQAGHDARGATLYLYGFAGTPCQNCTKHVITAGIKQIVFLAGPIDRQEWREELEKAERTLNEAGVEIDYIERD